MPLITPRQEDVSINLLPQDVRSTQKTKRWFQYAVAGAATIVVILIAITIMQRLQIAHQNDILADAQAKRNALQTQVDALREFEVLKQAVDASRATLATALLGDINWTKFLDDLDSNSPADSSLTSLSVNNTQGATPLDEPSLGSVQYAGTVRTMPGLANWLDTMSKITGLRFVYLGSGSKDAEGVTFNATAHLTEEMLSGRCQTEVAKCP